MSHGYAYRCEHCQKTEITEGGHGMLNPPRGWIVVAVASDAPLVERVYCTATCLKADTWRLVSDGAWM